jgi:chemotaxis protein histidine kinase CheA
MVEFKKTSDDELKRIYLDWANQENVQLQSILESYSAQDVTPETFEKNLKAIQAIVHNIKGMGTSFDFNLMTDIGTIFDHYLLKLEGRANQIDLDLVAAHVDTMRMIIENSITGDGGQIGQNMLATLRNLIDDEGPSQGI